jgi:hypothetical protein
MSAAKSARVAVTGSFRGVKPVFAAWHHTQVHGSPRRCKDETWLTARQAEQRLSR